MGNSQILNARQKALNINLDPALYGAFAEIGAGQEVARHFFRAGAAAGTVAKTICAYDMTVSDTIYGACSRYVSHERLLSMLDHEYDLLIERLVERAEQTRFFAYANTVQARNFKGNNECHGWMGVRFQHAPMSPFSQVVIHVRMLDMENVQQQEALGLIGVNLLYASFRHLDSREHFVNSLMEGLSTERIEVDMISVEGPGFSGADSRLYSLELVKRKFCQAVMFDPKGKPLRPADSLYKKNVVVLRSGFRPPTLLNLDMLRCGLEKFKASLAEEERSNVMVLPEISMSTLIGRGEVGNEDFLARVDLLACLDHGVLISNCESYSELSGYISNCSRKPLAFVLVVYSLEDIFDEKKHTNRPDGLLGSLGNLFGHSTRLYVYPTAEDNDINRLRIIDNLNLPSHLKPLLQYLLDNHLIQEITDYDPKLSGIWSRVVLKKIQTGEQGWEDSVPKLVANMVAQKSLFGYRQ